VKSRYSLRQSDHKAIAKLVTRGKPVEERGLIELTHHDDTLRVGIDRRVDFAEHQAFAYIGDGR